VRVLSMLKFMLWCQAALLVLIVLPDMAALLFGKSLNLIRI
jgi:hypothetical protein